MHPRIEAIFPHSRGRFVCISRALHAHIVRNAKSRRERHGA